MTSPESLRAAAAGLRREAARLVPTLDEFIGALGPDVWSGPAADRARSELDVERRALVDVAIELEELARRLDLRADTLSATGP